jgi:hypothetical protein
MVGYSNRWIGCTRIVARDEELSLRVLIDAIVAGNNRHLSQREEAHLNSAATNVANSFRFWFPLKYVIPCA